jgi:cytochrome c peroxidase
MIQERVFILPDKRVRQSMAAMAAYAIMIASPVFLACSGDETSLLHRARQQLGPLPRHMTSERNPLTPEKVTLGKVLFYETRISLDGTVSCSRCHPMSLYAADGLKLSIGNNCRHNSRNAPTLFNAAGQISQHWIGNRADVEDQARQSVVGPPSFGMPTNEAVERRLKEIPGYERLFKAAFPNDREPLTVENFAKAVGAFERTLTTPSPFDDFINGDASALTTRQKAGLDFFMENGCVQCHYGRFLGGMEYRKFGIAEPYWRYTKSETIDSGRYAFTHVEGDRFVFKVPSLRNVAMTSPYFHDGSIASLGDAISIMSTVQLSKKLSPGDAESLLFFLRCLTGRISADDQQVPLLPAS